MLLLAHCASVRFDFGFASISVGSIDRSWYCWSYTKGIVTAQRCRCRRLSIPPFCSQCAADTWCNIAIRSVGCCCVPSAFFFPWRARVDGVDVRPVTSEQTRDMIGELCQNVSDSQGKRLNHCEGHPNHCTIRRIPTPRLFVVLV